MKSLPNNEFFAAALDILRESGRVEIRMRGNSMYPSLRSGRDTVVLEPADAHPLKKGDIVLFAHRGTFILHRIISYKGDIFILRGDNVPSQTETAVRNEIKAIVVVANRHSGTAIPVRSLRWRILSLPWLWPLPVRRLLLGVLRRIYPVEEGS